MTLVLCVLKDTSVTRTLNGVCHRCELRLTSPVACLSGSYISMKPGTRHEVPSNWIQSILVQRTGKSTRKSGLTHVKLKEMLKRLQDPINLDMANFKK